MGQVTGGAPFAMLKQLSCTIIAVRTPVLLKLYTHAEILGAPNYSCVSAKPQIIICACRILSCDESAAIMASSASVTLEPLQLHLLHRLLLIERKSCVRKYIFNDRFIQRLSFGKEKMTYSNERITYWTQFRRCSTHRRRGVQKVKLFI